MKRFANDAPRALSCLLLVPLLTLLLVQPAAPQQDPSAAQPESEFFETVRVNVINIDVYVENRRGEPVQGLTEEDFELFVDGSPVPISNFYAASEGVLRVEDEGEDRTSPEESAPAPQAPAPVPRERGAVPADQQSHLVFYIDNFNLRPVDRNRVLRGLERFVAQAALPGTRMMLVTYDQSLHVRQEFTSDPRLIMDAAMEAEELAGQAVGRDADRRLAIDEIEDADSDAAAISAANAYADARQTELKLPIEALIELMEPLGGLPGRKGLVYVASGLPKRVGEDLFHLVDLRFDRSRARMRSFLYDMTRDYDRLVRAANSSEVTLYALDAGGLSGFDSLSAAEGGSAEGGSHVEIDSVRLANLQAPLEQMAHGTGGIALTNTNNLDRVFGQIRRDLTSYYSLGYQAGPGHEGGYHKIRVEVKRRGVRVRYRDGVRVRSLERRLDQGVMAALTMGNRDDRFGTRLVPEQPERREGGNLLVPLSVQIPLGNVTLVPDGERWRGRLLVLARASDSEGGLSPVVRSEPLEILVPADEYETARGQHITWTVELVMRPLHQRLAVGVADLLADQLGFTTTELNLESP